jgi:eukaryotic-like serine/threonine-protein kinase
MTHCPSEERLRNLLSGDPDATVSDSLSLHVEDCSACQALLGRLTEVANAELRPRVSDASPDAEAEERVMRRLKRMSLDLPPTMANSGTELIGPTLPFADRRPLMFGSACPVVPGYEIVGELGRGGMGIVYQARQLGLHRTVAIKMLRSEISLGSKDLIRFRAEAAAIARLQHPNIVQIYDFGEAEGRPYFVLEYVDGGSLAHRLEGMPQPIRPAAQLIATLARAVHVAHAGGVIHRDLKPANILLRKPAHGNGAASRRNGAADVSVAYPNPKIADFGLAKCVDDDPTTCAFRGSTVTGELLGTPNYMAPEQASVPRPPIGPAADVYALGAILYEMITGRPPFLGETPLATILQVLHAEPVSVTSLRPDVPRDVETICIKCLRKEPKKRYPSALELAEDLERFLKGEPILARPVTPYEKAWRWVRSRPMPAGLLAAGLLAPVVALVALSLMSTKLVRSSAVESAAQQAELLEEANEEYASIVDRVEQARYPVNKMFPPTPGTVPLSIPATFLHDVGERLAKSSRTGVKVRQFSDFPYPWRKYGGPRDDFERNALARLRETGGRETVHEFSEIDGQTFVRFAQARVMQKVCVECHNTHPMTPRRDWKEGDVRGVLVIIRPLGKDETRVAEAMRSATLLSAIVSVLLLSGSGILLWTGRRSKTLSL